MFVLFNFIASVILNLIDTVLKINAFGTIYALAVLIPGLAAWSRRLHDTGRSLWWFLLAFIPIVGVIVLIVFAAGDSQPGDNKYGPNPKSQLVTADKAVIEAA